MEKKVILITDGDIIAKGAVEKAAYNIKGRSISRSSGNPTPIGSEEIIEHVKSTPYDPVLIMVDDIGNPGYGKGEKVLNDILESKEVKVLGIIAVASNTEGVSGVKVDFSIDYLGNIVENAVNKDGVETDTKILYGDTVDIVNKYKIPLVVGIGDIGKMNGYDNNTIGSPILTKAVTEILKRQ